MSQVVDIDTALDEMGWRPEEERSACLKMFVDAVRLAPIALVSQRDRNRLVSRHLLPSLAVLPFLPDAGRLLDMGSGSGFPAIPLAIARPDLEFVLVDATRKKIDFLNACIQRLGLLNVLTIWDRLENLAENASYQGAFQTVMARAVAKLPRLLPLIKPFLAPQGNAVLWKGQNWRREGELQRFGFSLEQETSLSDGSVLLLLSCA
jgi:16S rRNA (guanine527-N7)-methyltransferase